MNTYWRKCGSYTIIKDESKELYNQLCNKLEAEKISMTGFCERIFRTGTFKGYNYNYKWSSNNKYMQHPFADHCFYLKTKPDINGRKHIYFVSQPYLNDKECEEYWTGYLNEEDKYVEYILSKSSRDYDRPPLDYIIIGKDKSFHNQNNTNLVIIGLAKDIENLNIQLLNK